MWLNIIWKKGIDIHKVLNECYGEGVESSGHIDIEVTDEVVFFLVVGEYISVCFNVIL